ncbi:hypothetical protein Pf1_01279 [Flavobacterium columnare]|nr:hypothetical protein Pf1_01279 [Flavobacterium columnare]
MFIFIKSNGKVLAQFLQNTALKYKNPVLAILAKTGFNSKTIMY